MLNTPTLLIVDDCAEDRRIYRRYLLRDPYQSYQIREADSAEEGLVLCQQKLYDLVLLDYRLPDLSGLDFFDRLKQNRFHLPLSAIMLTGYGDEEIAVQALKKGFQDYLVKQNLNADILQLAVRNAIEKSYLQYQLNKTQERQRLIATTALRIRQSLNLEHILHTAVAEVQQLLQCDRVVVYQFASDMNVCCQSSFNKADANQGICTTEHLSLNITSESIKSWQSQKAIVNIYKAGKNNCFDRSAKLDSQANLAIPINLSNNEQPRSTVWGLLVADQFQEERQWQQEEMEILKELAIHLAIAIQQAELLSQTQAALAKEKQLNTFKSQIVATVSHEYRTPLATILAAASTIEQHGEKLDLSKQQRFLQIICQKTRHLSNLVDDMLLFNQIELDKTKFKPVPLDLLQFFADLIAEQQLASEQHEFILKITGNSQGFWGDRGLLRQIFLNLISNAIKYSPDGGKIEFHLIGKKTKVVFHIRDRGIGIPIEDRENLFQSFFRASNADTIPGTGLGLAITKACVELHNGNIALESELGDGTKVTVSLPKRVNKRV